VTWLLLTGAGLVAETVVIVVLGSTATARYDAGDTLPVQPELLLRAGDPGTRSGPLGDHHRPLVERMDAVGDANG
jgi:hypothetical protein